jgi:hypothetical protein
MESVYHSVTIRVNETSWAHVWRLRSCYLRTRFDREVAYQLELPPQLSDIHDVFHMLQLKKCLRVLEE